MWRMTGGTGWTAGHRYCLRHYFCMTCSRVIRRDCVCLPWHLYLFSISDFKAVTLHLPTFQWIGSQDHCLKIDSLEPYLRFWMTENELCMERLKLKHIRDRTRDRKMCRKGRLARVDKYVFMCRIRNSSSKSANRPVKADPPHHRHQLTSTHRYMWRVCRIKSSVSNKKKPKTSLHETSISIARNTWVLDNL